MLVVIQYDSNIFCYSSNYNYIAAAPVANHDGYAKGMCIKARVPDQADHLDQQKCKPKKRNGQYR